MEPHLLKFLLLRHTIYRTRSIGSIAWLASHLRNEIFFTLCEYFLRSGRSHITNLVPTLVTHVKRSKGLQDYHRSALLTHFRNHKHSICNLNEIAGRPLFQGQVVAY